MQKYEGDSNIYHQRLLEDKQNAGQSHPVEPVDKDHTWKLATAVADNSFGYDWGWEPEIWTLEHYAKLKNLNWQARLEYYRLAEKYGVNHSENK